LVLFFAADLISEAEYFEILKEKGRTGNLEEEAYLYAKSNFESFVEAIKKQGWTTDYNLLGPSEWRASWNNLKKQQ
jgi:hypothetical protein